MTALWFDGLTAADRVSVKPHASPVLHAINHLPPTCLVMAATSGGPSPHGRLVPSTDAAFRP